MSLLIIGALFLVIALTAFLLMFWDDIFFTKRNIKKVYGEITYDNPNKIIVYDFSKLDTDGIAGMIYHSDVKRQDMEDEIRMGTLKKMEKENPGFSSKELMAGLAKVEIEIPHFYIMENATLLINRFTKKQVIEGEIERWTQ